MGDEKQAMVPGSLLQFRLPTGGITTRFYHPNPARLAKCVSCGVFPESLLKLQCSHHLCEVCVMSTRSYTCDIDSTTTEIQRPLTVPLTHNAAIKDAAVLCPGCSAFIHFGKIKGHIYKDHPKLLLQASPRPLVDNQAAVPPGGPYGTPLDGSRQAAALRHQGNESRGGASVWGAAVSPGGPYGNTIDGSGQAPALQHKGHESNGGTSAWGAAVPPAGPYGKTIDGSRQAPALQHQGHESHGGTSAWRAAVPPGGPHGNTLDGSRHAPALQHHGHESHGGASVWGHTGKNDEPAAPKDSADVDMEDADSCAQVPTKTFVAEHHEQSTNVSNTLTCKYCLKEYQVGKHEEHQNTCCVLFVRGWELFSPEIFKQYYKHVNGISQGSKQNIKTIEDHVKDGLFSSQEFKMFLRFLVTECFEEHLNKHCQGEPDVPTNIEEHTRTCPTFNSKCIDFWTQVLFGYEKPEDNIGCPTKEQDGESFQKKAAGTSSQYMGDEKLRDGKEKRSTSEECPYCSETWDPEEIIDHLPSCEKQFMDWPECEVRVHKDSYKEHLNQKCLIKDRVDNHAELKATPTREPEKTTAAMSFKEKYSLKDVKGLADGILIPFKQKLNPELACCICKALTPTGLKDGKGHTYCAYCTRVHTDALGLFTCSLCGWQAAPSEMSSNGEEWGILEKLTAACPNDNPKCTYQGTFKDVLVHYKSCALKTKVECPLCKSLHDRKTLAFHMAENCPKRVVECKFCNSDIEAWEKEIHEGSCRHRPGTCKYCLQEFSTIIELEEEHQPQCPKMPVKCSFYQLGCSFTAARSDVVVHEATTKHTDILMEHVCLLKAENESLKRTIENQEKKFQSIINNMKDSLPKIENRTNVAFERREVSAGTRQKKIEERLAVVEEMLRSYQLPFEQLLRSISDLK